MCMIEAEHIGYKLPNDVEGMEVSMERLLTLLDEIYKYVDDVVEGRVAPDNEIGRFISDTVASLPKLAPHVFDKLMNNGLQECKRIYLSVLPSLNIIQEQDTVRFLVKNCEVSSNSSRLRINAEERVSSLSRY